MSFLSELFHKPSNDYVILREAFSTHHQQIETDLNTAHPNATGVLARYGVDLRQIRKRAAQVVATAAVAGLLLAHPYKINAPVHQQPTAEQNTLAVSDESLAPLPVAKTLEVEHSTNVETTSAKVKEPTPKKVDTETKNENNSNDEANEVTIHNKKHKHFPGCGHKGYEKGHRGHTRGRSSLAPPKRHGLHDLGMHKGEKNQNGQKRANHKGNREL